MKASVKWINRLLEPGDASAPEVEEALTHAGLPIDAREPVPGGDVRMEVEITSNRGDCLSHIGLAREVAAKTGRKLKVAGVGGHVGSGAAGPGSVRDSLSLRVEAGEACPRFTARVIRGVKVGPSPKWMVEALESVGQRSINNVVDVTNYIGFEYGQPSHVFDLARLAGHALVVRWARDGEDLTTLDGKKRKLKGDELVVADAQRAQSLAGVIGGQDSEVSAATTDVVLEAATWDPVAVRRASRRHAVRTDASHRFERVVDARTIDAAAARAAALIVELAGGSLCEGVLDEGPRAGKPAALREIVLRPQRCRDVIGIPIETGEMTRILGSLEVAAVPENGSLRCRVPAFRPDLEREIDLIEEVARIKGFEHIPVQDRMAVIVRPPQVEERAMREAGAALTGLGFFETVTFSFIRPADAEPFLAPGLAAVRVDDERRAHEPTLRPSSLPSLLTCRKANQDGGVHPEGGVRLYETAATFAEKPGAGSKTPETVERRTLALLMDLPGVAPGKAGTTEERQRGVRLIRGAVESVVRALGGPHAPLEIRPGTSPMAAFDGAATAEVVVKGQRVGWLGLVDAAVQKRFDLAVPLAAAEIELGPVLALFPPRTRVEPLPAFPSIERDVSFIVGDSVAWDQVRTLVEGAGVERLEAAAFMGTYRGKQTGPGKKSLTLRLTFRDPSRTLRHEEVDGQVEAVIGLAKQKLGAEVRVG